MDREVVLRYLGFEKIEVFLKNNFKYTGKILLLKGNTIVFVDKFGSEVSFECELVLSINPIREDK